jgi:enoyl-CoA hydratase/carnithine racemase
MDEPSSVLYEIRGSTAVITFNRPDLMNAITPEMEAELHRKLDDADADDGVRVIVLTGNGRAFSAGYDQQPAQDGKARRGPEGKSIGEYIGEWHKRDKEGVEKLMHLWRLNTPVIAAVNGWAMGGGFWYQLAADITIASDKAVFAQPEVRHTSNTTFLLAALAGWKAANRYALTGDHFDAQEALRLGIVNEVVPHDELLDRALALAERIALVPEASVRMNKAITMMGLQAAGVQSGLLLNGALSAIAHSSYGPEKERLDKIREQGGTRAYLDARDGPFLPEPFGPKSIVREKV